MYIGLSCTVWGRDDNHRPVEINDVETRTGAGVKIGFVIEIFNSLSWCASIETYLSIVSNNNISNNYNRSRDVSVTQCAVT